MEKAGFCFASYRVARIIQEMHVLMTFFSFQTMSFHNRRWVSYGKICSKFTFRCHNYY